MSAHVDTCLRCKAINIFSFEPTDESTAKAATCPEFRPLAERMSCPGFRPSAEKTSCAWPFSFR